MLNFIVYLLMTVICMLAILATFIVALRRIARYCLWGISVVHLAAIVLLYAVRFSNKGRECANEYLKGQEIGKVSDDYESNFVYLDGKYLRSMAIAQTFLALWYTIACYISISSPSKFKEVREEVEAVEMGIKSSVVK